MIKKEVWDGQEIFAVRDRGLGCTSCMFNKGTCTGPNCIPDTREDGQDVYFVPLTDFKAMLQYTVQEETKIRG